MKLFANTRIKRNTAFVVLLVWLFALASGVANACLLETPELHSKAVNGSAPTTSGAPADRVGHLGASAGHDDDSDSTKESCLKVCDDGTHTLPSAYSSVDHTDPGPAPLVATLWTGSPQVVSALRRLGDLAIPIVGPPFRVRYSRLAL
jgi:hypothetical protein